jgi:hypothetical protein
VLPFALLLIAGALAVLFIALIGLGEGRVGVAALQTTADAAALAAADTARSTAAVTVRERSVRCSAHPAAGHPATASCVPGTARSVDLSGVPGALPADAVPAWAAAAGCSPSPEPTVEAAPGVYGPYCVGAAETGSAWRFSQNTADIAAQDAIDANMPTLGRYGTVTIQAVRLADGSGRASVTLSLDESRNAIAQDLHRPVVLVVTGTATPGGQADVGGS